jgi:hypothetical protein
MYVLSGQCELRHDKDCGQPLVKGYVRMSFVF